MPRSSTGRSDSLDPVVTRARSRAPRGLAAIAVAALLATSALSQSGLQPASATSAAAGPVPSTLVIPMGDALLTTRADYGSPPGQPIPVGPLASSIVIQPEFESPGVDIGCFLFRAGTFASPVFSAAEWNSGQVEFAITPTAGNIGDSLSCGAQDSFELNWTLTPTSTTATQVTLTQGEEFLTSRDDRQLFQDFTGSVGVIGIGDTIELVGAPGTWPAVDGQPAPVFTALLYVRDPRGVEQPLTDYSVSPDGSVLTLQIPDTLPPRFWGSDAYLRATATAASPSSPTHKATTSYESYITVAPDRVSKTRLTLLPPVALSTRQTRAVVRLSSPGLTDVSGKLTLLIDGSEQTFIFVRPQDHSRVSFAVLPLPKGTHKITIVFEGDPRGVAGSSATANLRVLR